MVLAIPWTERSYYVVHWLWTNQMRKDNLSVCLEEINSTNGYNVQDQERIHPLLSGLYSYFFETRWYFPWNLFIILWLYAWYMYKCVNLFVLALVFCDYMRIIFSVQDKQMEYILGFHQTPSEFFQRKFSVIVICKLLFVAHSRNMCLTEELSI